jgi:hypothetical protein
MSFRQVAITVKEFDPQVIPPDYDWAADGHRYFQTGVDWEVKTKAAWEAFCQIMAGGEWLVLHNCEPGFRRCICWGTYGATPAVFLHGTFGGGYYDWTGIREIKKQGEGARQVS